MWKNPLGKSEKTTLKISSTSINEDTIIKFSLEMDSLPQKVDERTCNFILSPKTLSRKQPRSSSFSQSNAFP